MFSAHEKSLYSETVTSLNQIVDREATNLNLKLIEVSQLTKLMQLDHQSLFPLGSSCEQPNGKAEFGVHKNGASYKLNNNGGASVYYSKSTLMGADQNNKAKCSELLDPLLKNIADTNSIITQSYFISHDNMIRIYPFINDTPTQFGPETVFKDYNFYYLADQKHNPSRKTVWTKAYLDLAGLGWMVSAVAPVYYDGKLEGVAGLDVTISTFVDDVLNIKLPWNSSSFIVDREGGILAMTENIELLLDMKELTTQASDSDIKETTHKPEEYNILNANNPEIKKIAKTILSDDGGTYELNLNGENFILKVGIIPETGWRMLTLVNSSIILQPIVGLRTLSNNIGYAAIVVILIFYAGFFLYLVGKSHALARKISSPIEKLSKHTTNLGKSDELMLLDPVGIDEIDQLSKNFNALNVELSKRSEALVQGKVREQFLNKEREYLESLAKFDNLTNLFSRHELNNILEKETQKVKRYQHGLGILLINIDRFKTINDNYGYKVGDNILRKVAQLLKKGSTHDNIVGRWAGDEFLVIYPEIEQDKLMILATKICTHIDSCHFEDIDKLTVSIGCCSHWQSDSSATSIINNANIALLQAKEKGMNQSVVFEPVTQ